MIRRSRSLFLILALALLGLQFHGLMHAGGRLADHCDACRTLEREQAFVSPPQTVEPFLGLPAPLVVQPWVAAVAFRIQLPALRGPPSFS